jgi:hypothetical protein
MLRCLKQTGVAMTQSAKPTEAQSRKAILAVTIGNVMEWYDLGICRSAWMSSSYALAVAIFGGFAPFISQWLIDATGSRMAPVAYVMAAAAVSFLTIAGLRETAYRPLR